jgi:hypothetical protein
MRKQWMVTLLLAGALGLSALGARAGELIDANGNIDGWGRPFGTELGNWTNGTSVGSDGSGALEMYVSDTMVYTEANDTAPIDYGKGTPYQPAPGGRPGELFDMEFLGWQLTANNQIKVLAITSVDPTQGAALGGHIQHLGDVFIDMNGDGTNEFALTAGQWDTTNPDHLTGGDGYSHQFDSGLYAVQSYHGITDDEHGAVGGSEIAMLADPFALADGTALAVDGQGLTFRMGSYDYGWPAFEGGTLRENGTWVLEWTFDVSLLGEMIDNMILRQTVECGNDFIYTSPLHQPAVPEPATVAMIGLGLVSIGMMQRRRRVARG